MGSSYQFQGRTFTGYIVCVGDQSPGVVRSGSTIHPVTSASWLISLMGAKGLMSEVFRLCTQVAQRYAFKVQDNPMGPWTYHVALRDSHGAVVPGMVELQVWDAALQVNKKTLLIIDSITASVSTVGGGGHSTLIGSRLPYNFGAPGALYVTNPGDILRLFITTASGAGVDATKSEVQLYCDQLVETLGQSDRDGWTNSQIHDPTVAPPNTGTPVQGPAGWDPKKVEELRAQRKAELRSEATQDAISEIGFFIHSFDRVNTAWGDIDECEDQWDVRPKNLREFETPELAREELRKRARRIAEKVRAIRKARDEGLELYAGMEPTSRASFDQMLDSLERNLPVVTGEEV